MTKLVCLLALVVALGACDLMRGTELPDNDAAGTDEMRLSPCACAELDYRAPSYRWRG